MMAGPRGLEPQTSTVSILQPVWERMGLSECNLHRFNWWACHGQLVKLESGIQTFAFPPVRESVVCSSELTSRYRLICLDRLTTVRRIIS
jgi:hypothetical protein